MGFPNFGEWIRHMKNPLIRRAVYVILVTAVFIGVIYIVVAYMQYSKTDVAGDTITTTGEKSPAVKHEGEGDVNINYGE